LSTIGPQQSGVASKGGKNGTRSDAVYPPDAVYPLDAVYPPDVVYPLNAV